jgi:hypothetical protein
MRRHTVRTRWHWGANPRPPGVVVQASLCAHIVDREQVRSNVGAQTSWGFPGGGTEVIQTAAQTWLRRSHCERAPEEPTRSKGPALCSGRAPAHRRRRTLLQTSPRARKATHSDNSFRGDKQLTSTRKEGSPPPMGTVRRLCKAVSQLFSVRRRRGEDWSLTNGFY